MWLIKIRVGSYESRERMEDILMRSPTYTGDSGALFPCNWQKVAATRSE